MTSNQPPSNDPSFVLVEESQSSISHKTDDDDIQIPFIESLGGDNDNQEHVVVAAATSTANILEPAAVGATLSTTSFISKIQLVRNRRANALPVISLPPKVIGGLTSSLKGRRHCNCKRSNCLKLYCDCFQGGIHCRPGLCNCLTCNNLPAFEDQRLTQIMITMDRNPNAFRPKQLWFGGPTAAASNAVPTAEQQRAAAIKHAMRTTQELMPMNLKSQYVPNARPIPMNTHNISGVDFGNPPTPQQAVAATAGRTGCYCKKSNCLKKYCECFQAAICCTKASCFCLNCGNYESNPQRILLVKNKKRRRPQIVANVAKEQEKLARSMNITTGSSGGAGIAGADGVIGGIGPNASVNGTRPTMAAAAAATVVGVIDAGLPPLAYAIPTMVAVHETDSGVSFPALSFGSTNPSQTIHPVTATIVARRSSTMSHRKKPPPPPEIRVGANSHRVIRKRPMFLKRTTELEAAWNNETATVGHVFATVRKEARKRQGISQELDSRRPPVGQGKAVQIVGTKLLVSVQSDMERLIGAIEKAERDTIKFLDAKKEGDDVNLSRNRFDQQDDKMEKGQEAMEGVVKEGGMDVSGSSKSNSPSATDMPSDILDESALLCHETMQDGSNGNDLSKAATRELTILANQDVALLRELTSIMRQKTLNISETRLRESQQSTERQ